MVSGGRTRRSAAVCVGEGVGMLGFNWEGFSQIEMGKKGSVTVNIQKIVDAIK